MNHTLIYLNVTLNLDQRKIQPIFHFDSIFLLASPSLELFVALLPI